jgi:hypothetical protein
MAIHRIGDESQSDDNLPWVNEYLEFLGEPEDISPVKSIKVTLKGLLILCTDFKGFLFKGSTSYEHLMGAIPVWRQQKDLPFQLVGIALKNGKLGVAVDDEFTCVALIDKKGNIDFKLPDGQSGQEEPTGNPFLVGIVIPPTTESHAGKNLTTPTARRRKPF